MQTIALIVKYTVQLKCSDDAIQSVKFGQLVKGSLNYNVESGRARLTVLDLEEVVELTYPTLDECLKHWIIIQRDIVA
jgi:hypothetical protein